MGLSMNNIHDPTVVPSGPTTNASSTNGPALDKMPLLDLIAEKTRVEEELKALGSVLDSHNVTMTTSLTTFDGFPRDDIDVAQVRTTRARIIRLKNDYKSLMSRIELGLHEHHAAYQASQPPPQSAAESSVSGQQGHTNATDRTLIETPFAKVNSVIEGSPSAEAGLKEGDRIRRFGDVNWINHEKLSKVAEEVRKYQGRSVVVKVVRKHDGAGSAEEELSLSLIPRPNWGGRGLLGCHLLPL